LALIKLDVFLHSVLYSYCTSGGIVLKLVELSPFCNSYISCCVVDPN